MATITYEELAKRLNACKLFNKAPELDTDIWSSLENGSLYEDENQDEENFEDQKEIYQWYLIDPSDAEYLKSITDELVFYSEVLDEYVWGVTHYGTAWSHVTLETKEPK